MKKSDVIYGGDDTTPQLCLSRWDLTDGSGVKELLFKYKINNDKINNLRDLLESYRRKIIEGEVNEAFCTIGFIDNDLYLIVKIKEALKFNYEYDKVILAERLRPKLLTHIPSFSEKIELKTYNALKQNDLPENLRDFLDTGNGYSIKLTFTVNGGKLSDSQVQQLKDTAVNILENIGFKLRRKMRVFATDFTFHKGGILELNGLIAQEDKEIKMIINESHVNKMVGNALFALLKGYNKELKLQNEWEVNCDVKSTTADLRITRNGIINHFYRGTDIDSCEAIAIDVKEFYKIVYDIQVVEHKLREDYVKSINDFMKNSYRITELVEEFYKKSKINEDATIKKIIDTSTGSKNVNYLQLIILGSTTKTISGEEKRLRYMEFLADARGRLNKEMKKLVAGEEKIKYSRENKFCRLRVVLKKLKGDCYDIMRILSEKEIYCEQDNEKLRELEITVNNDTSLYKLKQIRLKINSKKFSELTMEEGDLIAKEAANIKLRYKSFNDIYKSITTDLILQ